MPVIRDIAADVGSFFNVSFFEEFGPFVKLFGLNLSGMVPHLAMLNTVLKSVFAITSLYIILSHIAAAVIGAVRFCARVVAEPSLHATKCLRHASRLFRWFTPQDATQFYKELVIFLLLSQILTLAAYGNFGSFLFRFLWDGAAFIYHWRVFPQLSTAMTLCVVIGDMVFETLCSWARAAAGDLGTRKLHFFTVDNTIFHFFNRLFQGLLHLLFGAIILSYVFMGVLRCGNFTEFHLDLHLIRVLDNGAMQLHLESASIACILHLLWSLPCYVAFLLLAHTIVGVIGIVPRAFGLAAEMEEDEEDEEEERLEVVQDNDPGDLVPEVGRDDDESACFYDASQFDVSGSADLVPPVTTTTQPTRADEGTGADTELTTTEEATIVPSQIAVGGLLRSHSLNSNAGHFQGNIDDATIVPSQIGVSGLIRSHSLNSDDGHFHGDIDNSEDDAVSEDEASRELERAIDLPQPVTRSLKDWNLWYNDGKAKALRIIHENAADFKRRIGSMDPLAYVYVCDCPECILLILHDKGQFAELARRVGFTNTEMENLEAITAKAWDERHSTGADLDSLLVVDEHGIISPDHRLPKNYRKNRTDTLRNHFKEPWMPHTETNLVDHDWPDREKSTILKDWMLPKIALKDTEIQKIEKGVIDRVTLENLKKRKTL